MWQQCSVQHLCNFFVSEFLYLPKIGINDPTIKALEEIHGKLVPGRIVKIIRKSPTAGYYEYYRIIVKSVMCFSGMHFSL